MSEVDIPEPDEDSGNGDTPFAPEPDEDDDQPSE